MRRDEAERAISFLSASDNLFVTSLSVRLSLGGWIAAMVDLSLQATGLLTVKEPSSSLFLAVCAVTFLLELIWRIQTLEHLEDPGIGSMVSYGVVPSSSQFSPWPPL